MNLPNSEAYRRDLLLVVLIRWILGPCDPLGERSGTKEEQGKEQRADKIGIKKGLAETAAVQIDRPPDTQFPEIVGMSTVSE